MYVYLWFDEETEEGVKQYMVRRWIVPLASKPRNPSHIKVNFEVSINGRISHSPNEAVEAILPVAANQFFMFHGEDLRKMSQRHMDHTRHAIELIIDAETFMRGKKDAAYIAQQIENELDEERSRLGVVKEYLQVKKDIQDKISTLGKQIFENKEKIKDLNEELAQVEEKLNHYTESEKLLIQLEEKKKQLNLLEEERQKLLERRSALATELPLKLILPELRAALAKKEVRHMAIEEKKKGISELRGRRQFIEELLKEEQCVCDRPLDDNRRGILKAKLESLGRAINDKESKVEVEDPTYYELKETVTSIERLKVDVDSLYTQISKNTLEIDETKTAISKLEKALGEINREEIRQLSNRRVELAQDIRSLSNDVAVLDAQQKEQYGYLEKVTRNIQVAEGKTDLVKSLEGQLALAKACEKVFADTLEKLVEMRRETIQREATGIFTKLTNKPDEYKSLRIDPEYNISVIDYDGNEVQRETLSTGEREIVALSFVLGLMRASEKKAPLVLDTFFVHLDEAHYSNIVRALPTFAEQILLILTDLEYKNLTERAVVGFFDSVNKSWQVIRNSERGTSSISKGEEALVEQ